MIAMEKQYGTLRVVFPKGTSAIYDSHGKAIWNIAHQIPSAGL